MKRFAIVAAAILALAGSLTACGGSEGMVRRTTLTSAGWSPMAIPAVPGDKVVFLNQSMRRAQIISSTPPGLFDSGIINMGQAYEYSIPSNTTYDRILFEDSITTLGGTITIMKP